MIHDLAIVGGGVAAAAAALALRDGDDAFSACVIAPAVAGLSGSGPGVSLDRIGETLSSSANPILRELGVWEEFQREGHRPARATFSAWGTEQLVERNAFAQPGGPGWHIDRARFERWLWQCALETPSEHGASIHRFDGAVRHAQRSGEIWRLTLDSGRTVGARFLLDCTGRRAALAQKLAVRHRDDRLTAACVFLEQVDRGVAVTPGTLIEAQADGWWYSALVPDGRMVIAYFSDHDLLPLNLARDHASWRQLVAASHYTGLRIESAGFALDGQLPIVVDASARRLEVVAGENWAGAGDAAAALDPLSSHGMTLALWSGRKAALAARGAIAGDTAPLEQYRLAFAGGVADYRRQHRRIYALERRFADRPFWQRRFAATDAAELAESAANRF